MNDDERRALRAATRLKSAITPDDVWQPSPFHVENLNGETAQAVLAAIDEAHRSGGASPLGLVLEGQKGVGKTHLLGWVREQATYQGGFFFLVELYRAEAFWDAVALSLQTGLFRRAGGGTGTQLERAMTQLARRAGLSADSRAAVSGRAPLTRIALDELVAGLLRIDGLLGVETQDTVRAMGLYGSSDPDEINLGLGYLSGQDDGAHEQRRAWGIRVAKKPAGDLVREITWLLSMAGPIVLAIDQIDTLLAQSRHATRSGDRTEAMVIDTVADGLMTLRDATRRTLTVLACLPESWEAIDRHAIGPVLDRFRPSSRLKPIPTPEVGQAIVQRRLESAYRSEDFSPPYPTWPVLPEAFADAPDYTPRGLLKRLDRHLGACLATGTVRELGQLDDESDVLPPVGPEAISLDELRDLDERFAQYRDQANTGAPLESATEDETVPPLLAAGLAAWVLERGDAGQAFVQDPLPGPQPPLHARLRQSLDEQTEHEAHWSFRAIAAKHGNAQRPRLRNARTRSGAAPAVPGRHLVLLRNRRFSEDAPTVRTELDAVRAAGAMEHPLVDDDIRTFEALARLLEEQPEHLEAWLVARQPASRTLLLEAVLGEVAKELVGAGPESAPTDGAGAVETIDTPGSVLVGTALDSGKTVRLPLASLRRHTAIFAGSGSGKTVLIRRLVEDCARQGVSAIVLDPNNDLSRLGDPWPEPPATWLPGDHVRAADHLANTEVVVWTPNRQNGRPLTFQPLPGFLALRDDPDEFDHALDAAAATLVPKARLSGTSERSHLGDAVLREALRYYAQSGGSGLEAFIDLLRDLPDGVSTLDDARHHARRIADNLQASMVRDPLFAGKGTPVDIDLLLTPSPGKRARISVVNFIGLPDDEQRQGLVAQLQQALFRWVKANPAPADIPLGALFVMDEAQTFAPSGGLTPCTPSTLNLAAQARKYGLGLVFATQAPKGLHSRVTGNAATQFFGYMNAPAHINAANEIARNSGSRIADISRVEPGEFYVKGEGVVFVKTAVPMCLSHHPESAPSAEEVLERARRPPS